MKEWLVVVSGVVQLILLVVKVFGEDDNRKARVYKDQIGKMTDAISKTNKAERNLAVLRVLGEYKRLREKGFADNNIHSS